MGLLRENTQLYEYIVQHYSKINYRFEKIFGHSFPYKKLDLDSITDLKLEGITNLSGIDELKNLKCIEINGLSDLSLLEKCPNLSKIKVNLPEEKVDVDLLIRLSKKQGIEMCEFYGRGVRFITSDQALEFGPNTNISYDSLSKLNKDQFSKVQKRFEEIHSLIKPEMSEVEKVKIIYQNLLSKDFEYDYNNHQGGTNGYLINNTMYGPLVENKGVCSGISSALEHALKNEGLDAVSCGGWANNKPSAGDSHQWNQVKVDGEWYNLDLTNDYDKESWRFFMKSDKDPDWSICHYIDKEDKSEKSHDCVSTKYDEIYREDSTERRIRELQKQKEQLMNQKESILVSFNEENEYVENNVKS